MFMANLLTSMGWPCGHEAVFGTGGVEAAREIIAGRAPSESSPISRAGDMLSDGMDLVGDSSYMAAPFLDQFQTTVIHVIRNPIKVVGSLIGGVFRNFSDRLPTDFEDTPEHIKYESFIYKHLPDLMRDMPQLDRACLFYTRWNEMIEGSGRVDLTHKIEDTTEKIRKMFGTRGECYSDTNCNSFSESSVMWSPSQIQNSSIRREIKDMMKRYGYKSDPPLH